MMCKILELIENNYWRRAKTMPHIPHEYSRKRDWDSEDDFNMFVRYIRRKGYREKFRGRTYTYLNVNGWKYWTMGAPLEQTILINRAKIDYNAEYDKINSVYDELFSDDKYVSENNELIQMLDMEGSILDVGCGTGMLADYVRPKNYLGFDISQGMINRFKENHPKHKAFTSSIMDFYSCMYFNNVVGLFGVGSYITNDEIEKLWQYVSANGKLILMKYDEGYHPVTHENLNSDVLIVDNDIDRYCDQVKTFHNYKITISKTRP